MLNTVLALPSCNVGLQYYSLHFTRTAIKTIMVHWIAPCNFNYFIRNILIHKIQQHSGTCVANSTYEQFFLDAHILTIILHWYHINLVILWCSRTHVKPCLHFPQPWRQISSPYSSSKEKCNCCNPFGPLAWVWRNVLGGKCIRLTVYEGCLQCHKALQCRCSQTGLRESQHGCRRTSSTLGKP